MFQKLQMHQNHQTTEKTKNSNPQAPHVPPVRRRGSSYGCIGISLNISPTAGEASFITDDVR